MTGRLPRRLHAAAWWLWALGLAGAAAATTNPLVLALIVMVVVAVVIARRPATPAGTGFRMYLIIALAVVGFRVMMRALFGGGFGDNVLFDLPAVQLPEWASGVSIGGPVTVESILAALYDGARLATILVCVGAANTLADPRRLIKSLPRPLYAVGSSVVIALAVAPQLVDSVRRVRRARRLRGGDLTGIRHLASLAVPVLEDALEGAIGLAAAMDSRGFGRTTGRSARRSTGAVMVVGGMMVAALGAVALMIGVPASLLVVAIGLALAVTGVATTARSVLRTVYRPDPWTGAEWLVAGTGLATAAAIWTITLSSSFRLTPVLDPLSWPQLPWLAAIAILFAATAGIAAPPLAPTGVPATRLEKAVG